MKRTVGRWTAIQNRLSKDPEDEDADDLWDLIEYRTWGKLGQSKIAIRLTKKQEAMVLDAETRLGPNEEHPA
jgi:hypothetical protein